MLNLMQKQDNSLVAAPATFQDVVAEITKTKKSLEPAAGHEEIFYEVEVLPGFHVMQSMYLLRYEFARDAEMAVRQKYLEKGVGLKTGWAINWNRAAHTNVIDLLPCKWWLTKTKFNFVQINHWIYMNPDRSMDQNAFLSEEHIDRSVSGYSSVMSKSISSSQLEALSHCVWNHRSKSIVTELNERQIRLLAQLFCPAQAEAIQKMPIVWHTAEPILPILANDEQWTWENPRSRNNPYIQRNI